MIPVSDGKTVLLGGLQQGASDNLYQIVTAADNGGELIEGCGAQVEIIFANDPRAILPYTKDVLCCDIHTEDDLLTALGDAPQADGEAITAENGKDAALYKGCAVLRHPHQGTDQAAAEGRRGGAGVWPG